MNTNQKIIDDLAELPSAEYHDPSTASFPTNLEGKLLFYIAIAFSVFQVVTAAHLLDLPSQVLRAVHVGFLGLLALPLVCALKKKNLFRKKYEKKKNDSANGHFNQWFAIFTFCFECVSEC